MPRLQENFYPSNQFGNIRIGDVLIVAIIGLSILSIGWQTSTAIEGVEKEK